MKTLFSFLLVMILSNITIAQTTAIPDTTFEQRLITSGLDITLDGTVLTANIDTLTDLYLGGNLYDITGIEDFTNLTNLVCMHSQLTSLDVSNNTALASLICWDSQITNLDLTQNINLMTLRCDSNQLTTLDLSQNSALSYLGCSKNNLSYLNLKNGNNLNLSFNPSTVSPNPLICIEVDDPVYSAANWSVYIPTTASFSTNCCSGFAFNIDSVNQVTCADSGRFFSSTIGGLTPYSYTWSNIPSDSILTTDSVGFQLMQVTDSVGCTLTKGVVIEGPENKYSFDLNTGLSDAGFRPGITSSLNLFAWNDGCVLTSGQLSVSYSGPITFINSSITPDSNISNTLTWNFTNWDYPINQLFSSLKFKVDTTANLGDLVCFDISITQITGDADTTNNIKTYCFNVVNSYDPNDKQVYPRGICAENYVLKEAPLTYTIRFQNTGNASAINIFLLDTLSNDLDVNTLRVISKSHQPLITEVLEDSIIKFRFDNINLADSLSDEQGSKGYVTYEIYPNSGLVDGTVVENSAAIYFDFNTPIITNATMNTLISVLPTPTTTTMNENLGAGFILNSQTYTTAGTYHQYFYSSDGCDSTVVLNLGSTVSVTKNAQQSNISIYPNPTSTQISINTKLTLSEIRIIDITGKVVITTKESTNTINVSDLSNGIYFIQLITDERTITKKFVKQ
jgi:hypothetical protein